MRTLIAIVYILILTILVSCDNVTSETTSSISDTLQNPKTAGVDTVQSLQESENTAISFLTWYRDSRAKLASFQLVDNANVEIFDSTKYYAVNFSQTEKYLDAIKSSGYVSTVYIETLRGYFKNADKHFKANPQNDGPPENFEYDFVMRSQEIETDLENIEKIKSKSQNVAADKVLVILYLHSEQKLKLTLTRHMQKWLIDSIESASGR